jgi:uncharacterized membrane protein
MENSLKAGFIFFAVAALLSIISHPFLPGTVVSHWNAQGFADGYIAKEWLLVLFPAFILAVAALISFFIKKDPLYSNILKFKREADLAVYAVLAFLLYVYALMLLWNTGVGFSMAYALAPAMAILLFILGVVMRKAKRNYVIGIRTPWTLANDRVWDKTHRLGSKLLMAAGVIALGGLLFPSWSLWFFIIPVVSSVLVLLIYSYLVFSRQKK